MTVLRLLTMTLTLAKYKVSVNYVYCNLRYENSDHRDYVTDLAWNPLDINEYLTSSWDGTIKKHKISN